MCDFDGTLSEIAKTPPQAHISPAARRALARCVLTFPVAIITGRSLSSVRSKARIPGLWYVGNHGLEWFVAKERGETKLPKQVMRALVDAYKTIRSLAPRYPGLFVGNKRLTLSVHTRNMTPRDRQAFRRHLRKVFAPFSKRGLVLREGQEYVYNVRPKKGPNKGDAVRLIRSRAPRGTAAIFIGDDTTDEDAFRALKKGITIRVGKRKGSAARYFVNTRTDVDTFLKKLADAVPVRKR